jgi:hypothetical protein
MVNKKGFIRVIEAILAIVIVFGFLIFTLSSTKTVDTSIPYQLDVTSESIIKQIQTQPDLRNNVLKGDSGALSTLDGLIGRTMPETSPMDYAISVQSVEGDRSVPDYVYEGEVTTTRGEAVPLEVNVYVKKVFITVSDVTVDIEPDSGENEFVIFSIYMWYKID